MNVLFPCEVLFVSYKSENFQQITLLQILVKESQKETHESFSQKIVQTAGFGK